MVQVILVIHLLIAIAMVGVILIQRSEGGVLGIGGGGGVVSGRSAGNILTRATGILACAFFVTSLALAIIADRTSTGGGALMDTPIPPAPESAPASTAPAAPAVPAVPTR